jgi:Tfp pilus assembly protein PilX
MTRYQKGKTEPRTAFTSKSKGDIQKMAKHQKGSILIITILVMFVGAIIMAALFSSLTTSLSASSASEERSFTYYAADSGVEDAFFWLERDKDLPGWAATEEEQWEREPYTINGRTVFVSVEDTGNQTYRITSTAATDTGSSTTVESYVFNSSRSLSVEAAIATNNTVRLWSGTSVTGNVLVPDGEESRVDNKGTLNGTIEPLPDPWPTAEEVSNIFWDDVCQIDSFPYFWLDVAFEFPTGHFYKEGNLEITNSLPHTDAILEGTVYVAGDLDIGKGGSSGGVKDFTIDLNGQTIFVEGTLQIYDKCTITGSGSIIALGDVLFGPKMQSDGSNYVFVMSVEGSLNLHPNGTFYGSAWGHDIVEVQPKADVVWVDPGSAGYISPTIDHLEILTYNIIQ